MRGEPLPMIEWTAAGTVRCIYCKAEWIGRPEDGHDDPCCMMWVMQWDPPDPPVR